MMNQEINKQLEYFRELFGVVDEGEIIDKDDYEGTYEMPYIGLGNGVAADE